MIKLVHSPLPGPAEEIHAMEHLSHIAHHSGYSSHDCFAYAMDYFSFETNEVCSLLVQLHMYLYRPLKTCKQLSYLC